MDDKISMLSINALKPHPKNAEFFDDASGEAFEKLKDSISHLGVLTPLRVASDMTIISGHQRWRACKELGLTQVPVIIAEGLEDEDDKEMQLIASNFGRMKNDPVKQGKLIAEYERLAGVYRGNHQKVNQNNFGSKTQEDIAKELGVTTQTLRNLKKLNTLDPEIQELISIGKLTPTTGFTLIAKLSPAEQAELVKSLGNLDATKAEIERRVKSQIDKQNAIAAANGLKEETQYKEQAAALEKQLVRVQEDLEKAKEANSNFMVQVTALQKEKADYEEQVSTIGQDKEFAEQNLDKAQRELQAAVKERDELQQRVDSRTRAYEKMRTWKQEEEEGRKKAEDKLREFYLKGVGVNDDNDDEVVKHSKYDELPEEDRGHIEHLIEEMQTSMNAILPCRVSAQALSDMRLLPKDKMKDLLTAAKFLNDRCVKILGSLSSYVKYLDADEVFVERQ